MKKKIAFFTLVIAPIALITSCAYETQNNADKLEEAKQAIAERNAIYFTSFAKNDSSIFINRYAEDACLMPAGVPKTCGKEALAKFFREKRATTFYVSTMPRKRNTDCN